MIELTPQMLTPQSSSETRKQTKTQTGTATFPSMYSFSVVDWQILWVALAEENPDEKAKEEEEEKKEEESKTTLERERERERENRGKQDEENGGWTVSR